MPQMTVIISANDELLSHLRRALWPLRFRGAVSDIASDTASDTASDVHVCVHACMLELVCWVYHGSRATAGLQSQLALPLSALCLLLTCYKLCRMVGCECIAGLHYLQGRQSGS